MWTFRRGIIAPAHGPSTSRLRVPGRRLTFVAVLSKLFDEHPDSDFFSVGGADVCHLGKYRFHVHADKRVVRSGVPEQHDGPSGCVECDPDAGASRWRIRGEQPRPCALPVDPGV
jgi:hypothetical protein